jgi:hypothetical protein
MPRRLRSAVIAQLACISRTTLAARSLLVALPLAAMAGCGFDSTDYSSGGAAATPTKTDTSAPIAGTPGFSGTSNLQGTNDAVIATTAVAGTVAVVAGAARTVSVIFNSNDGRLISGFGISGSLGSLPAGWSGPASFACGSLSVGSSCVLNLTYAPTAVDSGVLTLNYVYLDDATQPKTGDTLNIPYQSTAVNNVAALASPTGQINAVAGSVAAGQTGATGQTVTVNFTTDDGNPATNLTVTSDLAHLPPGWTSGTPGLSCPIVSTGNGCELALRYAPTAAAGGTLVVNYTYTDESGAAKAGALNIPYAATSANNLTAAATPAGQVTAAQKSGGQSVPIAFTTDDGKAATQVFVTSDLKSLPAGWSSAAGGFSCAGAGSGNGCQLLLNYAPTAPGAGTLALHYAYKDSAGAARTAMLNIDYAATTNDNVAATASPAGPIAAVLSDGSQPGTGTQPVTVTFTTDDGRPATALSVTTDLAALPAGWHAGTVAPFTCAAIDPDTVCSLSLTYTPTAPGAGTLVLSYAYENNAGESRTGSVNIAYRATENDNVQWTTSALPTRVRTGSSTPVTITFQTDDGNPASSLAVTTPLNALPAGWSSAAAAFSCASVSAGTPCTLSLTYAPTAAIGVGTLSLGYRYVNDAGYPGTGTVTLTYGAYTPYIYVVNSSANTVGACALNLDNTLAPCTIAAGGFSAPTALAVAGTYAYVTEAASVSRCTLGSNGGLAACAASGGTFMSPTGIVVNAGGSVAYVTDGAGITLCAISPTDGGLSGCTPTGASYDPLSGIALTADNHAFSVGGGTLEACTLAANGSGTLGSCAAVPASTPLALGALAIQDNNLYLSATSGLYVCPINGDDSIGSCHTTAAGVSAGGLVFFGSAAGGNSTAYVSAGSATVLVCPVNADGSFAACVGHSDVTLAGAAGMALRPQ